MMQPLLITQGDPTGVGPEIILKALLAGTFDALRRPLVVAGDVAILRQAAAIYGQSCEIAPGEGLATHRLRLGERELGVAALSKLDPLRLKYGAPDAACGQAMLDYIEWACARCLAGEAAGIITAPINKAAIRAAGGDFPGHTELLAARCAVEKVVMMLAGERLRVALVTTHLALREVPSALTTESLLQTLRITHAHLQRFFALPKPRLAVLALNPHAGESGLFGDEETRIIAPAIAAAQAEGLAADGPHSADSLFHFASQGSHDAVICMYHDQGLIPLKLLHFDDAVNLTLGLPIVRTSVDHGTAYDLAGSGRASHASLAAAVRLAAQMADQIS
ncbi:4-hydroxythreonine-4-phosphate dehydrogenase [Geoalkalibacter ferrihydriticus]|nr:4-hydroxythreonine-4-phosphate dehydrogenase PdxA [Geoalkalibacter ferrihydriticus]SDL81041.1 4-hydroxythreonine-4-phosphate dehydrogenase [Geoalkalibacter ferrihydriticus]